MRLSASLIPALLLIPVLILGSDPTDAPQVSESQVASAEPLAFRATINESHLVKANSTCTFTIYATGGTLPYTYSWGGPSKVIQTGGIGSGGSLSMTVTDAVGAEASETIMLDVGFWPTEHCTF